MQGTVPGARRRGRPRTAWVDNIKTWTGLPVEESIRMSEDRDKWRKYVHGVANARIVPRWGSYSCTEKGTSKRGTCPLTYRAQHGSASHYLASSFTCVADMMPHQRRLRSASTEQLDAPTCRRSTIGGRAFPVAGTKVWNGLPSDAAPASSLVGVQEQAERRCYETV